MTTTSRPARRWGATLRVGATAVALAWKAVVRVLERCGASACLASQGPLGSPATWRNPDTAPREVIVAVGSQNAFDLGDAFDLTVAFQR